MDRLKKKWKVLKVALCARLVKWAATECPELVVAHVLEKATEMGVRATMAILDQERIAHCWRCPERFGLRKMEDRAGYSCGRHVPPKEDGRPTPQKARAA